MKTYLSWSGGKDSTASVILCKEHGIHLDGIIYCEVMFDNARNISGENPEHVKWVNAVAIPTFERWGYKVERLRSADCYTTCFNHIICKGKRQGKKNGYPLQLRCIVSRDCKMKPLKQWQKSIGEHKQIVGIAIDEPERLKRLDNNTYSVLAQFGYTEAMARDLCAEYGLLSPLYESVARSGCWFCPNQRIAEWALTKREHPELWAELKLLSQDTEKVSENITRSYTFEQLERKVDEYNSRPRYKQTSIFDRGQYDEQ